MPIALYHGLSDHDLMAMVAYLRAVPPVQHAVTERSTYPFPLTAYGPPVAGVPDPPGVASTVMLHFQQETLGLCLALFAGEALSLCVRTITLSRSEVD